MDTRGQFVVLCIVSHSHVSFPLPLLYSTVKKAGEWSLGMRLLYIYHVGRVQILKCGLFYQVVILQ